MANIKKIKIGTTTYDIVDASVDKKISTAIEGLDSSATVASESDGTITIAKSVKETDGKISAGTETTTTNTVAKIDEKDAATLAAAKKYADGEVTKLVGGMVFKGSVGTSGTIDWTALPTAAASNKGYTYKVITNHSSAPACKVGDMIISNGTEWVVIPSGDEPSGTVTSVATGTGLSGGPITTSGTISINRDVVNTWYDEKDAAKKAVQALDVTNAGNVSAADASNKVTLKNINETDGKVGVIDTNSAVVYNATGVDKLIEGAKGYAKTIAETEDARQQVDAGGAHTHSLSASGSCTPNLTSTAKHITASATAPTVTMSSTKFLTGLGEATKAYLVTDTIAANGMVTNLSANKDIYSAKYDEATECLELSTVTLTVTKNANAITYATGASTTTTSSTASFVTGYSSPSSAAASVASVTKPTITLADTATSGGVVLLSSVAGASTPVTVSGTVGEAGSHSHTLSKKTA